MSRMRAPQGRCVGSMRGRASSTMLLVSAGDIECADYALRPRASVSASFWAIEPSSSSRRRLDLGAERSAEVLARAGADQRLGQELDAVRKEAEDRSGLEDHERLAGHGAPRKTRNCVSARSGLA